MGLLRRNTLACIAVTMLLTTVCGCGGTSAGQTDKSAVAKAENRPAFSADSAYRYVEAQVEFGPRVPGSEAHAQCRDFLTAFFRSHGAAVTVQEGEARLYDGREMSLHNIIASYNPDAVRRVMLCAHWDSRPYADSDPDPANHRKPIDGANDGASGVGVLMETARAFGAKAPGVGVDIILFDLEDWGIPEFHEGDYKIDTWCLGSQYWGRTPHVSPYRPMYGILLDMVGAPGAQFCKEGVSMHFAPDIVEKVWRTAADLGFGQTFRDQRGGMVTDDHLYVNTLAKIPCIDIIQYNPMSANGFGDYWHTLDDNMSNIDRNTLHAVGETLLELIYSE